MIIFDLDVDDVNWLVEIPTSGQQICTDKKTSVLHGTHYWFTRTIADSIETPLFASDDYVGHRLTLLPALGRAFDAPVSIDHL